MSYILAVTLPLPVLLALVASLLVSLAVAAVVVTMRWPAPVRLPQRGGENATAAAAAAAAERD